MTGRSDYLLRVIAADLDDYERFVRRELHREGLPDGLGHVILLRLVDRRIGHCSPGA